MSIKPIENEIFLLKKIILEKLKVNLYLYMHNAQLDIYDYYPEIY